MCIMLYTIVTDTKVYIYIYIYIHSLYSFYLRKYYEKCIIGKVIGIDIFLLVKKYWIVHLYFGHWDN